MFNDNVTQTYSFQDASQEIVVMLLGAFLLGSLLTWLLSKLFNKDYSVENNAYRYQHQNNNEINTLKQPQIAQANTTNEVRIVDKPTNPIKPKSFADDLTKISGIDTEMQGELKKNDIASFADLRDIETKDLIAFQQNQPIHKREIETWPHQASLAAKGDWTKLKDYQGFIQRVQIASNTSQQSKPEGADDLTQLVGVSSEIENILNKKEISTFKQLSHMDTDILKKHLVYADLRFTETETESWPHQAAMAEKGQWEELKIYQEFMHSDSDFETKSSTTKSQSNDQSRKTKASTLVKNSYNLKAKEDTKKNINETLDQNLSDHDDLKKIEGVGPKIEEVLNKSGIYTFSQLYNSNRDRLRKLLDDAGNQFRMHDPESWPHQAGMANRSEWTDLKTYQNSINKDKSIAWDKANSVKKDKSSPKKDNKLTIAHQKDDLRKIEGIGPKIQELLNKADIYSFKELSKSTRDLIKKLLNEAGPQFRMHEPESWPHQAKLAAKGEWDELEKYQEFLIAGRE